jgi:hypothetical protein
VEERRKIQVEMKSGAKEIIVLGRKVVEGFKCFHSGSGANREQPVDLTGRSAVHKQSKGLGFWILESIFTRDCSRTFFVFKDNTSVG